MYSEIMTFLTSNFWLIFFLISFVSLIFSVWKEPRRFRNAILMMCALIGLSFLIISKPFDSPWYGIIVTGLRLLFLFLTLIVPVLLLYDTVLMIRREGFSLGALLAALFALMIISGETALALWLIHMNGEGVHLYLLMLGGYTVFYISVVFLSFMFYSWAIRFVPRRVDFDYIVVLGCGLIEGNKVSRLLGDRLDKAYTVYDRSMSACKIITSGGQGPDETVSEAEAMKQYLIEEHNVAPRDIITEDQSANTMENLKNSQAIIQKRGGRQFTAVVTSGYHALRADIYAEKIGFPEVGIGAHTALYYWPAAMIREYAALIRYYWKPYFLGLFLSGAFVLYITHIFF